MAWRKVPKENEELLARVAGEPPGAELRRMFGCPVYMVNGNMLAGAHQQSIFVRLSEADREEALDLPGAAPFTPMPGRVMREYVVLPASLPEAELAQWVLKARDYAASLPPKERKR